MGRRHLGLVALARGQRSPYYALCSGGFARPPGQPAAEFFGHLRGRAFRHQAEMAFFHTPHESECHLARIVTDTGSMLYLRPVGSRKMFVGWRECDRLHGVQDMVAEDPDDYNQNAYFESLVDMLCRPWQMVFSPNRLR